MVGVLGTRVDEGERARADQVGVGALEGEVVGVVGDHPSNAGAELARLAIGERHAGPEGERFGHGGPLRDWVGDGPAQQEHRSWRLGTLASIDESQKNQ